MIPILNGLHETVRFEKDSTLALYSNAVSENYPNHWHTPIEIIMPLNNSYCAVCNDVSFPLRPGDILLITPGTIHKLYAPPEGIRIIFQADLSVFYNIKDFEAFISLIQPVFLVTPEAFPVIHEDIKQLLKDIKTEYDSNAPMKDIAIYSKLFQIIVLISRHYTNNPARFPDVKSNKQQEYIEKFLSICDYISQNCTNPITLEEAAAIAGFSKYHFSRLFKEFTNTSFYRYLNIRRIAYAEKLLLNPELAITEIAFNSGFNNFSSFIRMFRIVKNCTPTEFRNMYHGQSQLDYNK